VLPEFTAELERIVVPILPDAESTRNAPLLEDLSIVLRGLVSKGKQVTESQWEMYKVVKLAYTAQGDRSGHSFGAYQSVICYGRAYFEREPAEIEDVIRVSFLSWRRQKDEGQCEDH
jgi:hypothetical protein